MLVLGFLLARPMHGYEISQALKNDGVEVWFEISAAAIYYSLNKLHRLGHIAEAHSRGVSGDRTIYHVTESGREQFFADMRGLLASREPVRTAYDLGISMLNRMPQDQVEPLLKIRVEFLETWIADLESRLAAPATQPLQRTILQHSVDTARLDIDWLIDITAQLRATPECEMAPVGLMTLHGDLRELFLPDLIMLITSGKHSGTLTVSAGRNGRSMTFEHGVVHCVASQLSGKMVLDEKQVLRDVYELFGWQTGIYVFDQRGCPREGCVMLDVSAHALMLEGARRLNSWQIIQHVVPTSDSLFAPTGDLGSRDDLALRDDELRVLGIVDGVRNITTIAGVSGLTEFETSRILYGLYLVDLIQMSDPDKSRLRRVFREFVELMCRGAIPYRTTSEEASACEADVNLRSRDLPVSIRDSRIVDRSDPTLSADALAGIYRRFRQTQHAVLGERLGRDITNELRQQVLSRISPDLRATLEQYALL
ncbi:MAG: DUF4388 domain-containing protein [Anaerolineae bacterium]|nr:DUF4388 domain-containing protein [Anaerolineae bacterium]